MPKSSNDFDIIILGAGAAGLLCAFTAARRGRRVLVLEKSNRVGKKILISGGGRCNFSNYNASAEHYISKNPHFCKSALDRYTQWDFIALVERHGIAYEERSHGQLFCIKSAREILAMLLKECDSAGVTIQTHCDVSGVVAVGSQGGERTENDSELNGDAVMRYRVKYSRDQNLIEAGCQSLVVATGALSIPTLGGSALGYEIARQFSLPVTELQAGLVPFMFSDAVKPLCEELTGVSLPVEIACHKQSFSEDMLFTHRGISGPAVLQISNYWRPGDEITINLLPGVDAGEWLLTAKKHKDRSRLKNLLQHKLPKRLVEALQRLWWAEHAEKPLIECGDKQLQAIGRQLNGWILKPSSTQGYRTAEVTLGGVDTNSINSKTMEAKQQPGLYFIGEVLDVTGHLGGFNFQWAWSSGHSAGLVA